MNESQTFVASVVRLHDRRFAGPKLVRLELQLYTTTQAPDRSVVAAFLAADAGRFMAEVEAVEW